MWPTILKPTKEIKDSEYLKKKDDENEKLSMSNWSIYTDAV